MAKPARPAATGAGALACNNSMLRPFQKRFLAAALSPGIDTALLSLPRGNGKSWLAAHVLTRCLTPGDPLHVHGSEFLLCAASIEQARIVFRFVRGDLEPTGEYRFLDSATRIGITHKPTNTRLRVLSSSGKRAMGIVNCPVLVADEPGSWETNGGQLMHDAIQTAQGKPGSPMRVIYIGTLAPAMSGWWHKIIERGSHGSTHVTHLIGDAGKWDSWPEIRRCNPLTAISGDFRRKLLEERDEARSDSALKARFLSYRLNLPSADETTVLLTVEQWQRVLARPVPEREGRPVFGYDLGYSRAWSAAVAAWPNGRVEALACTPGIPAIAEQEKRDRVPRSTYAKLVESGSLRVASDQSVTKPDMLHSAAVGEWGRPRAIYADRFQREELADAARGIPLTTRATRWSESTFDIRMLRRMALDGSLAVAPGSRALLTASMAAALVRAEEGNLRLEKATGKNNWSRDDAAVALTLVAGALERLPPERTEPLRLLIAR